MSQTEILIVEDENIVALDMMNRLRQFGYIVAGKVSNGEDAITAVHEKQPNVVLMDIQLSGEIDGITAAEKIREVSDVPVIFITAYADKATLERAKITEAFGYLIKPYNDRELYTNIEIALYKHTMERRVRRSEQWLEVTLNSIADGVIATNRDNTVRFMNPTAEKLTGYSAEESKNKTIDAILSLVMDEEYSSVINEDTLGDTLGEDASSADDMSVFSGQNFLLRKKDGEEIPIEVHKAIIGGNQTERASEGKTAGGSVYVVRDVSVRRRFEMELQQAKKRAEAANMAKSTFLANMTHELRTPLNSIIGMTDVCLNSEDEGEIEEYLTIVRQAGTNLLSIINTILDYSNIESGTAHIKETVFDLKTFFTDVIEQFTVQLDSKKLNLSFFIEPDVPRKVIGDKTIFRKVVIHLLENAIKFTDEGSVTVDCELSDEGKLHITVKDTGIGMEEEEKEKIFTAFTQVDDSYTRSYGGAGLGLSIVKNMINLLRGTIWVESKKHEGSEFHVIVPFRVHDSSVFEERYEYVRNYTEGTIEAECPAAYKKEFLAALKDLAQREEYDKIGEKVSRVKAEGERLDNRLGESLFKLILAARREDKAEILAILDQIECICNSLR